MLNTVFEKSQMPLDISAAILDGMGREVQASVFIIELLSILRLDNYLWLLVDKENPLGGGYEPDDLVVLGSNLYTSRQGIMLRRAAAESLEEMAAAAKSENITLTASSTYRSFTYQADVYARNVRSMGQAAADRVSARPGYSQHQLGLVIDFGSITNDFARTPEGIWLARNASRFGWSLSYPEGMEDLTGYSWESWHYRYVGKETARFIDTYFAGIQQYALRFLHEWTLINIE